MYDFTLSLGEAEWDGQGQGDEEEGLVHNVREGIGLGQWIQFRSSSLLYGS